MKMFKGKIELKGDYKLRVFDTYFGVYNSNGNQIYHEHFGGYWEIMEYDTEGNQIYYEHSDGYIIGEIPKPVKELTVSEISDLLGYKVKIVKEGKL